MVIKSEKCFLKKSRKKKSHKKTVKKWKGVIETNSTSANTRQNKVLVFIPCHSINETRLKKQVSTWQQAVTDEVLIGAHCHAVAHTQRAQHLQNLEHNVSVSDTAALKHNWKKQHPPVGMQIIINSLMILSID